MVTKRGIEASPEQIKAILELEPPKSVKDIQKLTGSVAALNRFISRSSESNNEAEYEALIAGLKQGILPLNKQDAKALKIKAASYTIINNVLFNKSQVGPYLRCLEPQEAEEILSEIHEGHCGNHKGGRSLASKVLRTGYFWPTLRADCLEFSSKCKACQIHAPYIHQPSEELHSISAPWPFMKWGMDIVGKLAQAPGQNVFMLAMTNYFSKWIEADSFRQIKEKDVISFIRRNIICRYGIPAEIVCDNGSQFIGRRTIAFCEASNIKLVTSTPGYPKANGQAKSSNKVIINCLKKKLTQRKGRCEVMIPLEIDIPSARCSLNTVADNTPLMEDSLDLTEELRDAANIRLAAYQQIVAKSYNKSVKAIVFRIRDLFLRTVFPNTKEESAGKLAPTWEGSYLIDSIVGQGAYRLQTLDGEMIPQAWNVAHLKLFHI
ncbi:uncharacterized protein LOC141651192 [Silene latifolia]|uniref:uncharacterized protein LOC141651192 n=1 Tax=Silene latifolia TaxID=37657 RepID=UPI003D772EB9